MPTDLMSNMAISINAHKDCNDSKDLSNLKEKKVIGK